MKRYFNTEGACSPKRNYMVKLDKRLKQIKEQYVDPGKYFLINRGRQYGKTTTLRELRDYLREEYIPVFMDFQGIGSAEFRDEEAYTRAFSQLFAKRFAMVCAQYEETIHKIRSYTEETPNPTMRELFQLISELCAEADKPVVLLIDEVDSASNNQVFLDFLALLRQFYLERDDFPIFQSVILAGVYDIKNLKQKIRSDSEHKYNSPWNIAASFDISMSLSADEIAGMLAEYDADHQTGMDEQEVAAEIYDYTSGYPYLVSALCKLMDENVPGQNPDWDKARIWSRQGLLEAVKLLLKVELPLFGSMVKQLQTYPELARMIQEIVYQGARIPYSPSVVEINLGMMFGFLKEQDGQVQIANRIFEMYLLNMFAAEDAIKSEAFRYGQLDRNQFLVGGRLDMDRVLERFVTHYSDIYGSNDEKFIEKYGRKFFLLYLKPIINGTGNYYLEAQTRDERRTDVIVDYRGEQFIVELKIWHGNEYNERGESQLADYLDAYHQAKGYMLSFNFNKNKQVGVQTITVGDKTIVEAVV